MSFLKQFGGKITKSLKEKYSTSSHWDGAKFFNLEETTMNISFQDMPGLLRKQLCGRSDRAPKGPLTVEKIDLETFTSHSDVPKAIWYGHSALCLRINDKTILIDPMLGPNASPIAPFATKRFSENTLSIIDELPAIDILMYSHDHYDHIDYDSFKRLSAKINKYFVALGVGRHLVKWGVDPDKITEFDWWQNAEIGDLKITFTPSRHFSGRGVSDRAKSMWGGWVFTTPKHNIYFSGDGGYGSHFKEIGKQLGPFDFGFIECGQYNELWHAIHMYPEEAAQAAIDAGVKVAMPVHWGAFSLAMHHWKEPIDRFIAEAKIKNLDVVTPSLGLIFDLESKGKENYWWREVE